MLICVLICPESFCWSYCLFGCCLVVVFGEHYIVVYFHSCILLTFMGNFMMHSDYTKLNLHISCQEPHSFVVALNSKAAWLSLGECRSLSHNMNAIPDSVFSGPMAHLLSVLYGLMMILPQASVKKKTKTEEGFQIWYFYWSFQMTSRQWRV